MSEVEQNHVEKQTPAAADKQPKKVASKPRKVDVGPQTLPGMEHFVQLVRKVQRTGLIATLVEHAHGVQMPIVRALTADNGGSLSITSRNAVFTTVAALGESVKLQIEHAAERVHILSDEFGSLAVGDLLNASNPDDAAIIAVPTDKFSRALYLYLRKENGDDRFEHAEERQVMYQQSQSEKYSSLYLGPKGAQPSLNTTGEATLRQRLKEMFPQIKSDEIIVEWYETRDVTLPEQPVVLYTLIAVFHGKRAQYQQIADGSVKDRDEPAVTNVRYSWRANEGELAVFCDDEEVRPELAKLFRDLVLGGDGDIKSLPIWEFNLIGFSTPEMLTRFKKDRISGIEFIEIRSLVVTKPEMRQRNQRGRMVIQRVENPLVIHRDRFEDRDIYAVAREVHPLADLTGYFVKRVKLTVRITKTAARNAHNVSIQITAPNGFNDRKLTNTDSELVFAQLLKLDCARQY